MRTEKKLLVLVRDELKTNPKSLTHGLCSFCKDLLVCNKITYYEFRILLRYISSHEPKKKYVYNNNYYWCPGEVKPRLNWLNHQIKFHWFYS